MEKGIIELVYFLFFDDYKDEGYLGKTKKVRFKRRMYEHNVDATRYKKQRNIHKWMRKNLRLGRKLNVEILHEGLDNGLEKEREIELQLRAEGVDLKNMVACGKKGGGFNLNQPIACRGKDHPLSKAVKVYDKNKNFIGEFESISQATKVIFGVEKRYANKPMKKNKPFKGYYFEEIK